MRTCFLRNHEGKAPHEGEVLMLPSKALPRLYRDVDEEDMFASR
jgi:hypothetical protein